MRREENAGRCEDHDDHQNAVKIPWKTMAMLMSLAALLGLARAGKPGDEDAPIPVKTEATKTMTTRKICQLTPMAALPVKPHVRALGQWCIVTL